MKLYKPVLIESAKQAEALPIGTIAISSDHQTSAEAEDFGPVTPAIRSKRYEPYCPWFSDWNGAIPASDVIGWTALVPIEAEEEHIVHRPSGRKKTVYVTDWQEDRPCAAPRPAAGTAAARSANAAAPCSPPPPPGRHSEHSKTSCPTVPRSSRPRSARPGARWPSSPIASHLPCSHPIVAALALAGSCCIRVGRRVRQLGGGGER